MKGKRFVLLLSLVLCVVTASAIAGLNSQSQEPAANDKKQLSTEADKEQGPIADYLAQEPSDPEQRAKRKARGRKYDKVLVPIDPTAAGLVQTTNSHWDMDMPPLPAKQSNLIVIGKVTNAQAFLSPSKASVYSEFTISVEKVFKDDGIKPLVPEEEITAERLGGRVRLPGGGMQQYVISRQGFPRNGGRYLFFLSRNEGEDKYFHILTAYELREGQVFPLDNGQRFKIYKGAEEASFLNEAQRAKTSN
jgi:hypothetical protein